MEKRTVLFVDDDIIVLQSLERGLMDESYNKFFAKTCEEAHEILQREEVHVIVTDMCMPEMTGLELLRTVKQKHPDIIGIVLSGYDQDADLKAAVDQGEIFRLINKPWKLGGTNFEKIVMQAIEQYNFKYGQTSSEEGKLEQCKSRLKKWIKLGSNK
ncbi:MAG: response regulator [Planctomycetes bacterium]|nr:response regulator [Planctomycetota bacterium]MBL7143584.1 response regulator [Phycisphaerae bacterium]